jgi:hypothetical protein
MRMIRWIRLVSFLVLAGSLANSGFSQIANAPSIRLLLSEVMPGSMSADQYCTLVFSDHRFHSEKASRHHGKDADRKVFEGELTDAEWSSLNGILDNPDFRDLKVPQGVTPLIMQDTHPYSISVARSGNYQNMEFLDGKSLKPYQAQVKPLLQWWKALRAQRLPESKAPVNDRCSLDSTHGIVAQ